MQTARLGSPLGPWVTPEEFMREASPKYREREIFPYCPACHEIVEIYGIRSLSVPSRFDHKNRPQDANPLDDCLLANRNDSRFKGLLPDDWDYERGKLLRSAFFKDNNLKIAYAFCLEMCGKENLSGPQFNVLIGRADAKNIWAYADMPIWVMPYILLTFENFSTQIKDSDKKYGFHFVLEKPKSSSVSVLWGSESSCYLRKVFTNNGATVRNKNNPYPVQKEELKQRVGDTSWITDHLLRILKLPE